MVDEFEGISQFFVNFLLEKLKKIEFSLNFCGKIKIFVNFLINYCIF